MRKPNLPPVARTCRICRLIRRKASLHLTDANVRPTCQILAALSYRRWRFWWPERCERSSGKTGAGDANRSHQSSAVPAVVVSSCHSWAFPGTLGTREHSITPSLRDGRLLLPLPGTMCLATIIRSIRDDEICRLTTR
jgi:hypothetical protein